MVANRYVFVLRRLSVYNLADVVIVGCIMLVVYNVVIIPGANIHIACKSMHKKLDFTVIGCYFLFKK